jgi:hypothetical protein
MSTKKHRDRAPCSDELGGMAWRDELLSNVFEVYLGISRLMAAVQIGPPKPSSPRKKRLPHRGR